MADIADYVRACRMCDINIRTSIQYINAYRHIDSAMQAVYDDHADIMQDMYTISPDNPDNHNN